MGTRMAMTVVKDKKAYPKTTYIVDARKTAAEPTGVGHYAEQVISELEIGRTVVRVEPARWSWFFHIKAAITAVRTPRAVYYSPESLIVPAILGKRAAVTLHDLTPLTHPEKHTKRNIIFHKIFLKACLYRVGAIFTPTAAVRSQLAELLPHTSAKTYISGEGTRFTPTHPKALADRNRTVLYVGTIEPRKNVESLIRAFISCELAGWELRLVGRVGWISAERKREFDQLIKHPQVKHLGYISEAALAGEYASARIFVYPSEAEGFGLPVLEAMANRVPCITSDDPALTEVSGGTTRVIRLENPIEVQLAEAIRDLTQDSIAQDLADAGFERSSKFDWSRAANAIAEQLDALAN